MKNSIKLLAIIIMFSTGLTKTYAQISVGISISAHIAPPALPVYTQPECPADGYLWTPGYWAYGDDGYYWVPGVWLAPPQPGFLWTPGYWGYEGGAYAFHGGYWGRHVGFYGGVNYGGGYIGSGFVGGEWHGGAFRYNTAVVNVNRTVVHNTYVNNTVINNTIVNRTSFNGPGGVSAQPRPEERAAMNEHHIQPTTQQQSHEQVARNDKRQYASVNHGRPATAAFNKVGGSPFRPNGNQAQGLHHGGFGNNSNQSQAQHQQNQAMQQHPQNQMQHPQTNHAQMQQQHPQMQHPMPQHPQVQHAPQPHPQMPHPQGRPMGGGEHERHG